MQRAIGAAILLHLSLLALLPAIPELDISNIERSLRLNVLIEQRAQDTFDQRLNYPNSTLNDQQSQTSLQISNQQNGEEETSSDPAPEALGDSNQRHDSNQTGQSANNQIKPEFYLSLRSITRFAQQQAVQYAEKNPNKVAKFNRGFNSRQQYRQRTRSNSYRNRYGDVYVRNQNSGGDICFVKTADRIPNQPETYTVHFFRCESKEITLESKVDS